MSPVQLPLFPAVEPSSELLQKVEALVEPINEVWNLAIDERQDAPAGMKAELRRLVEQLEGMLITLEAINERHKTEGEEK